MSEYQEQQDYEALNADTAMRLNKAQQRISKLESTLRTVQESNRILRLDRDVAKVDVVNAPGDARNLDRVADMAGYSRRVRTCLNRPSRGGATASQTARVLCPCHRGRS